MRLRLHMVLTIGLLLVALSVNAKTYTRVGSKQEDWSGTYLLVYENSSTQAYVWNCEDKSSNYEKISQTTAGKITSDDLAGYEVELRKEGSGQYGIYVKSGENKGYIGTKAKNNGILFGNSSAQVFTLQFMSPYVYLETNSKTQRFFFYPKDNRFRIYYDKGKDTNYKNITLYKEGDGEVTPAGNVLNLHYAQADFYACSSVFSGTYPYWDVDLTLAAEDDEQAVPMVWMQILSYSQYSIAGTYKGTWTDGRAGYIHATTSCGAACAGAWLMSKKETPYQVAIRDANLEIKPVKKSSKPNFYTYHIKMDFLDSNGTTWAFDDNIDVYGVWIDCDRSNPKSPVDMDPVPFTLEGNSHGQETALPVVLPSRAAHKYIDKGRLVLEVQGLKYSVLGQIIQ